MAEKTKEKKEDFSQYEEKPAGDEFSQYEEKPEEKEDFSQFQEDPIKQFTPEQLSERFMIPGQESGGFEVGTRTAPVSGVGTGISKLTPRETSLRAPSTLIETTKVPNEQEMQKITEAFREDAFNNFRKKYPGAYKAIQSENAMMQMVAGYLAYTAGTSSIPAITKGLSKVKIKSLTQRTQRTTKYAKS